MMERRVFLLSASAFALTGALAGCGNLLGPSGDPPKIYPMHAEYPPPPAGPAVPWALAVMTPDTSDSLDTTRIALLRPDGTMDFYADAQFPDRVTALVEDALVKGFEASGRITQVARIEDAQHADYNLLTEIRDFQARYDQQDGIPTIQVTLTVKLATAHGRKIVGSFTSAKAVPASSNNVAAAVAAFQTALLAAATDIVAWTLMTPAPTHTL